MSFFLWSTPTFLTVFNDRSSAFSSYMNVMAPPRYVMTTTTLERTEGLSVLNQAMAAIKERIEEKRCVFNIQIEVRLRIPLQ